MTDPARPASPGRQALPARVFRALFQDFDLHSPAGTHVAVPQDTPWYAASSLSALARQISSAPAPGTGSGDADRPQRGSHD